MISEYTVFPSYQHIIGIDEAGRGPIAGPVVAAAVILPKELLISTLNDSKKLSAKKREALYEEIKSYAVDYSWAKVDVQKIDRINILQATLLAMRKSVEKLKVKADFYLVDGKQMPFNPSNTSIIGKAIVRGDQIFNCIAAASIVAKVVRDEIMVSYDKIYPEYDFLHNKGYPTKKHIEALRKMGICSIHRKSFLPVKTIHT
jgi:ribonuclease HII